jgi:putative ABC transport system permease protein
MLHEAWSRLVGTLRRRRMDEEFDEEVRDHLEMLTERFIARGMDPRAAHYAARRQFGGVTQMKQELRDRRALPPIDVLVQDLRHAFRQLWKAKGFTASAALTLALGIGATTAVFAVLDTVVLRPLPYPQPDRIMAFRMMDQRGTPHIATFSYPTFFDLRAQNRVFEHVVCYRDSRFTLTDSQPAVQVAGEIVSWDLFPLLGVQPELGRGFVAEEEKPGTHAVVLSHELWRNRFGGDREIVGRTIRMDDTPFTVVGVAPAGFQFPIESPEVKLWTTLARDAAGSEFTPLTEQRGARVLDAIGRLKAGVSAEQARAQMDQIAAALARQYPDENKNTPTTAVWPELERMTGRGRTALWILLGAVAMVLMIACANVANLLLARSTERAREFTLRSAVGASRPALVRQLLIESLALGSVGTLGGVLLASAALKAIVPLAGDDIPRLAQTAIDGPVLAFCGLVAIVTAVLFSVVPIIRVVRLDLASALREGAANIARGQSRFRGMLVVGQITLGLILLVGAELMMASFLRLTQRDPGFRTDHLLTFDIGVPKMPNVNAEIAFADRVVERLRAIPGVREVATGYPLPLTGDQVTVSFDIEERRVAAPDRPNSDMAIVNPEYFHAMGIRLIAGREFTERDDVTGPRVLVVNEAFARKFFPGENAIGKRIESGATNGKEGSRLREIVGVVGNAKQAPLSAEPDPIYYFPYKQLSWFMGTVVMRTELPPLQMAPAVQAALGEIDRRVPLFRVRTGDDVSAMAIARPRFLIVLMGSFAAIALLLTAVGLYGVLSYTVARRGREIGVRIALGAERGGIVRLVFRDALRLVAAGLAIGLIGAVAVQRLLESVLYEAKAGDPKMLAIACGLMVLVGLAASYAPAARAASVDPVRALRSE